MEEHTYDIRHIILILVPKCFLAS